MDGWMGCVPMTAMETCLGSAGILQLGDLLLFPTFRPQLSAKRARICEY
jgi:hypothetical protein